MDYFYLKIGHGNSKALQWLSKKSPVGYPAAVIYFDNLTLADYKANKVTGQPYEFYLRASIAELRKKTLMVVTHQGKVWILKPSNKVTFLPEPTEDSQPLTTKVMPVEILACKEMKDVPPVLASIGVNQFYARGTFRRINHWGNFKAIDCVIGSELRGDHWDMNQQDESQLLECLGPVEFETLIAKLLESKGCFVPAYRGGLIADVDLFAHNDSAKDIHLGRLVIKAKSSASIQVKTWSRGTPKIDGVDYLIGLDTKEFDAKWVLDRVLECPDVKKWLERSLNWLPEELLKKFKLVKAS